MALIAITTAVTPATPPVPPGPYKNPRGPPEHLTPHRAPLSSSPGRHTAAHAPVSHPPNSPRPTPPLPPLDRRPWTPERPEAEAPASPVPSFTAGPPWTEIPVVHGPVDPVCGNFFNQINSLNQYFQKSCKEVPGLLGNQPTFQILPLLHSDPRVFQN
jgi:hypothetical protein